MDTNEAQWIARSLAGDEAAFRSLYAAHAPRVTAYFRRCGFTHSDADDLTQEVFVRVFKSLPTFDPARGTFRQWLAAIACNVARRRWRRRKEPDHFDTELAGEVFAVHANPADTPETREQLDALRDCIQALPADLARLVRLRYVDARTTRGIALAIGMAEATVRARLNEAVASLHECLKKKGILT